MTAPLNPLLHATEAPPIPRAQAWVRDLPPRPDRPLLNLSQAAPADPPPLALREALARAVVDDDTMHLYGPVLGLPALRRALAEKTMEIYGARVEAAQVAITAGCNQAFVTALGTLAGPGDEVILPVPWYFNHKMACDMAGVRAVPLPCGDGMLPDPDAAAALITPATRAIVLVTPNNPTGAEYPAQLMAAFRDLCAARGLALVVDETYRDFHGTAGAPHDLFADMGWDRTLIHLYSFSKAFRLTGHRVGAMIAHPDRLAEAEKMLDTVTICPAQPGQQAALWGLRHLDNWVAGERAGILSRRRAITDGFAALPGWDLDCCGAYFAWVRPPWDMPSEQAARHLLDRAGILALPGAFFAPDGDVASDRHLRVAFANADAAGI